MLVVEPDRRYSLKQVMKHRWLSEWISQVMQECQPLHSNKVLTTEPTLSSTSIPNLNSVVTSHMLQLSGLTADKIAQSVHEKRFDNIYAIYHLLYDKLQQNRREFEKIQQHVNRAR